MKNITRKQAIFLICLVVIFLIGQVSLQIWLIEGVKSNQRRDENTAHIQDTVQYANCLSTNKSRINANKRWDGLKQTYDSIVVALSSELRNPTLTRSQAQKYSRQIIFYRGQANLIHDYPLASCKH